MEAIRQLIETNGYYLLFIPAVIIVWALWMVFYMKKRKAAEQDYLGKYPDAAKVYLTAKALITSEAVSIHLVNGENPALFAEGGKSGFYIKPGENVIDISYSYTRPGVIHKNVTTTRGNVQQQLTVEPRKSYMLGFDRDQEHFTFEEIE